MASSPRIASVDILRGLTIVAMILVNTPGDWNHVYTPLLHAEWHGLTPTDLIFPFFLFIVGISIYFAYKGKEPSKQTYKKIVVRSAKLIGLGVLLNAFTIYYPFFVDLNTVRIPGVLQRIGVVFLISSILYLHYNWKVLIGISISILIGYWLVLGFLPFPNGIGVAPSFNRVENNWANYIDRIILGKHMWQSDYDPEGLISTIPAVVSCLIGILIGKLLDCFRKVLLLLVIGVLFLILGYMFHFIFPINKAIWTSSFVLVTSGWGILVLTLIYYLRDVKQFEFGTLFKYAGMNAITLYFLSSFINKVMYLIMINEKTSLHEWVFVNVFVNKGISLECSSLLYALSVVVFYMVLAHWMARKKIFIKI